MKLPGEPGAPAWVVARAVIGTRALQAPGWLEDFRLMFRQGFGELTAEDQDLFLWDVRAEAAATPWRITLSGVGGTLTSLRLMAVMSDPGVVPVTVGSQLVQQPLAGRPVIGCFQLDGFPGTASVPFGIVPVEPVAAEPESERPVRMERRHGGRRTLEGQRQLGQRPAGLRRNFSAEIVGVWSAGFDVCPGQGAGRPKGHPSCPEVPATGHVKAGGAGLAVGLRVHS